MPNTPRPYDSDELRASIKRLSEYSEQLRELAKKNDEEAAYVMERVKALELRLAESEQRKAKKTTDRIS